MLFDTHAHMDDRAFDSDRVELLSSLPERGIALLMNPGCSLASSRAASRLSQEYSYIYAAVGSHPDAADEVNEAVLEEYRKLCKVKRKIKAIGEIGLDYHYEDILLVSDLYARNPELKNPAVIIDTNHSNSGKQPLEQIRIAKEIVMNRRLNADVGRLVKGLMIESYIEDGAQPVGGGCYGKSITDACLGWDKSQRLILDLAEML